MKLQRGCTWRFAWLKYEHVCGVEDGHDGSSEGTSTFEVEIKGAFEVTIEFHLKMHMVVHILVQKSSKQFNKWWIKEALYIALDVTPKISL